MAKLVDAPASGAGGFTAVEVRVLFAALLLHLALVRCFFIAFKFALEKQERTFFEQIFNYACSGFSINLVNFLVK